MRIAWSSEQLCSRIAELVPAQAAPRVSPAAHPAIAGTPVDLPSATDRPPGCPAVSFTSLNWSKSRYSNA